MTKMACGFPKEYESVADPDQYAHQADGWSINEVLGRFEQRFPTLNGALAVHGFSGHGFKIGPAIGECMAEYITEGASSLIDISVFDIRRFALGTPLRNAYGGNRA